MYYLIIFLSSYSTSYSVFCHGRTSRFATAAPPIINSNFVLNKDKYSKKKIDLSLVLELFKYYFPINIKKFRISVSGTLWSGNPKSISQMVNSKPKLRLRSVTCIFSQSITCKINIVNKMYTIYTGDLNYEKGSGIQIFCTLPPQLLVLHPTHSWSLPTQSLSAFRGPFTGGRSHRLVLTC